MTKERSIETMEISGDRVILRERVTVFDEDGSELTHKYEQRTIRPDDDVSEESNRVQKAAEAARTTEE